MLSLAACEKRQKEIIPQNITNKFLEKSVGAYRNQGQYKLEITSSRTLILESYFFIPTQTSDLNTNGIIPCKSITKANIQDVYKIPKNRGDQNYSRHLSLYIPSDTRADYIIKFTSDPVISIQLNKDAVDFDPTLISDRNENLCKEAAKSQSHLFLRSNEKYLVASGELGENIEFIDNFYQNFSTAEEKLNNDTRFRKGGLRLFVKEKPGQDQNNKLTNLSIKDLIPDYQESRLSYEIMEDPYDRLANKTWLFNIDSSWNSLSIKSKSVDSSTSNENSSDKEKCTFSFKSSIKSTTIPYNDGASDHFDELQKLILTLDHFFNGGTVYKLELENIAFDSKYLNEYESNQNKDSCQNSRRLYDLAKNHQSLSVYFMLGLYMNYHSLIFVDPVNDQTLGSFYLIKP